MSKLFNFTTRSISMNYRLLYIEHSHMFHIILQVSGGLLKTDYLTVLITWMNILTSSLWLQIESLSLTFHGHDLIVDSELELNYGRFVSFLSSWCISLLFTHMVCYSFFNSIHVFDILGDMVYSGWMAVVNLLFWLQLDNVSFPSPSTWIYSILPERLKLLICHHLRPWWIVTKRGWSWRKKLNVWLDR